MQKPHLSGRAKCVGDWKACVAESNSLHESHFEHVSLSKMRSVIQILGCRKFESSILFWTGEHVRNGTDVEKICITTSTKTSVVSALVSCCHGDLNLLLILLIQISVLCLTRTVLPSTCDSNSNYFFLKISASCITILSDIWTERRKSTPFISVLTQTAKSNFVVHAVWRANGEVN